MYSPPGSYYASGLREKTAEHLSVESLVRAHATPTCSIHDLSDSLASDLLARFPAALETIVSFQPNIRKRFRADNLLRATCAFLVLNTRTNGPTAEQNSTCRVTTEWQLPISPRPGTLVSLILRTEERIVRTVHDQILSLEPPSSRSSLNHVHPTFGLHEKIAKLVEQLQSDRAERAGLLLAQCVFHLADQQYPCKRLQNVDVTLREVVPLSGESRTNRAQMEEKLKDKFPRNAFPLCNILLERHQYEQSQRSLLNSDVRKGWHRAYLALGSNIGNRIEMIESAIREMSERGLTVLRTSALYETKPMYLENQETFINGTCEVCSTDAAANSRPGNVDMARLKHR